MCDMFECLANLNVGVVHMQRGCSEFNIKTLIFFFGHQCTHTHTHTHTHLNTFSLSLILSFFQSYSNSLSPSFVVLPHHSFTHSLCELECVVGLCTE